MIVEYAAVIVAIAFVVLIVYLIPTILQLKRTVGQSERLLAKINSDLPHLLNEIKGTTEDVHAMTNQAREGVDQTSVFFKAIGEIGGTINKVHGVVRGKGSAVLLGVTSLMAGMKAASSSFKHRVHKDKEGGQKHV